MRRKRHRLHAVLLLALLQVCLGCNRKTIYSHFEHTPLAGWEPDDSLTFVIAPIARDGVYAEQVGLRISGSYPFMGLTLVVDQHVSPSEAHYIDTLHAALIDQEGNIQGQGISYFLYNFRLRQLQLSADDSLHICIRHNMKREMLPGISDVGITLTREE